MIGFALRVRGNYIMVGRAWWLKHDRADHTPFVVGKWKETNADAQLTPLSLFVYSV